MDSLRPSIFRLLRNRRKISGARGSIVREYLSATPHEPLGGPHPTPIFCTKKTSLQMFFGGRGWIRTTEAITQQIYSLPPLAAREPFRIIKLDGGPSGTRTPDQPVMSR